jgi:rubrerythrin
MSKNENLIRIFEYALGQERHGKGFFEHSLKGMGNNAAKSAIRRLIKEEEEHIAMIDRILKGLRDGADLEAGGMGKVRLKKSNFFNKREKSEFIRECIAEAGSPDVCVFNTAWLIEKDLAEFYAGMADRTGGEAKKAFRMLADWEAGHAEFFKEYRDRLTQVYSGMY